MTDSPDVNCRAVERLERS